MMKIVVVILSAALFSGCVSKYYVENPAAAFGSPPLVDIVTDQEFSVRTTPDSIELYYFNWTPLNAPNAAKDWRFHFVLGEDSSPSWAFVRIADIDLTQSIEAVSTPEAIAQMRVIASNLGGDGLVDLKREVMIDGRAFGSQILGYRYLGSVVRRLENQ